MSGRLFQLCAVLAIAFGLFAHYRSEGHDLYATNGELFFGAIALFFGGIAVIVALGKWLWTGRPW